MRKVSRLIKATETSDGAGVKLSRSLGSRRGLYADPFLMLDEFATDKAADYIAGFPEHPHRGFETVTYMLDGRMEHRDHLGNVGLLEPGGVQWMTAGRGVIHSEMPLQEAGLMRGFQLWINLPAREKMQPAWYRDIPAADIPEVALENGARLKLIAGQVLVNGVSASGPINSRRSPISTDPTYVDLRLPPNVTIELPTPASYTVMLYPYAGNISLCSQDQDQQILTQHLAILGEGDSIRLASGNAATRLILLMGKPINEPVEQYGPFVMNTRAEIRQAIEDYNAGKLVASA